MTDLPQVIETVPIPDTFASGVGQVENIGHGLLRFHYYVVQGNERILVAKIILPAALIANCRKQVDAAMAYQERLELPNRLHA